MSKCWIVSIERVDEYGDIRDNRIVEMYRGMNPALLCVRKLVDEAYNGARSDLKSPSITFFSNPNYYQYNFAVGVGSTTVSVVRRNIQ